MRKRTVGISLLLCVPALHAAPIVYEGFDYTAGVDIDGQNGGTPSGSPGWNGNAWSDQNSGTGHTFNATNTGLQFTDGNGNTLVSSGQAMIEDEQNTGAAIQGSSYRRTYDVTGSGLGTDGTEGWVSYRVNVSGSGSHGFTWGSTTGNATQLQIYRVNFGGSTNTWRLQIGASTDDLVDADGISATGDYLVIMKVEYQSGADPTSVWFVENGTGDISSEAALGTADLFLDTNGVSANNIAGFTAGNFPTSVTYDELRAGTSFSDVVPIPEPSSLLLVAVAMGSALFLRRNHK